MSRAREILEKLSSFDEANYDVILNKYGFTLDGDYGSNKSYLSNKYPDDVFSVNPGQGKFQHLNGPDSIVIKTDSLDKLETYLGANVKNFSLTSTPSDSYSGSRNWDEY